MCVEHRGRPFDSDPSSTAPPTVPGPERRWGATLHPWTGRPLQDQPVRAPQRRLVHPSPPNPALCTSSTTRSGGTASPRSPGSRRSTCPLPRWRALSGSDCAGVRLPASSPEGVVRTTLEQFTASAPSGTSCNAPGSAPHRALPWRCGASPCSTGPRWCTSVANAPASGRDPAPSASCPTMHLPRSSSRPVAPRPGRAVTCREHWWHTHRTGSRRLLQPWSPSMPRCSEGSSPSMR